MKFECITHTNGTYDPEWLSGSLYATIPIFGSITYVLGSFLYDDQNSPIVPFAFVTFVPLAIGVALVVFNAIRHQVAKHRISTDGGTNQWGDDSVLPEDSPRLQCYGDKVELMRLRQSLLFGERNISVTPYTRFLFLGALLALCLFGWIAHMYFDVSKKNISYAFYAVIIAAILWRLLLPFQFEIHSGHLTIRGVGLVSQYFKDLEKVALRGAAIDCRLQDGAITVRPQNGAPVDISLNGISRKHALVAAIFAAAREPRE